MVGEIMPMHRKWLKSQLSDISEMYTKVLSNRFITYGIYKILPVRWATENAVLQFCRLSGGF
jgi:hypothetical protein